MVGLVTVDPRVLGSNPGMGMQFAYLGRLLTGLVGFPTLDPRVTGSLPVDEISAVSSGRTLYPNFPLSARGCKRMDLETQKFIVLD